MANSFYAGKRTLVTGGTGSIGSEIVRQLLQRKAAVVRIFSRDETKHYTLQEEFGKRLDLRYLVGDVRDKDRLRRAMEGIDIVFHAAALKHVPLCEYNPFEAVQTNVGGAQNIISAAMDAGVRRVIAISTDKAVNPINTMGATKLLAERVFITADMWAPQVCMACVRFGNVIGSRGSIVPLVRAQIARGGPVFVTNPKMTRFMMSIPDAASLVLEAGRLAMGGEVFILKMPVVKLEDLLHVLIERFAGKGALRSGRIKQERIGPRTGEKQHQELLMLDESQRTLNKERMLIMYPHHRIERSRKLQKDLASPPEARNVVRAIYESEHARPLTRGEIVALLDRAGVEKV